MMEQTAVCARINAICVAAAQVEEGDFPVLLIEKLKRGLVSGSGFNARQGTVDISPDAYGSILVALSARAQLALADGTPLEEQSIAGLKQEGICLDKSPKWRLR